MTDKSTWPTEIRLNKEKDRLTVTFNNGQTFSYSAEFLRVNSPSAEVQGHHPGQRQTVPGKKTVLISSIDPVGHYAIKILFLDGHNTGIYSWDYLYELGVDHDAIWQTYLDELKEKNLSRG